MWRLVSRGLRFYTHTLLISWAAGAGIFLFVLAIIALVGSVRDLHDFFVSGVQLPLAILIASMVAGFIVLATERNENRLRTHMMLPVPTGDVAVARVVLPALLMVLGVALSHAMLAVALALEGAPVLTTPHLNVDFIGIQLLLWLQLALTVREIIELRRRLGWTKALPVKLLVALIVAAAAVVMLGPSGGAGLKISLMAALNVAVMLLTVALFQRRAAFTK
jgi:hypothetical protein